MSNQTILYENAKKHLVGGCSAGGRHHAVYGQPLFLERVDGSKLYDVDGKEYIDYHTSAGVTLFGNNNQRIKKAAMEALELGNIVHLESKHQAELADHICDIIPCAELVRLGIGGTDVTQIAIRLARGYTGRELVVRFEGHFHGMHESIWFNQNQRGEVDEIGEVTTIPSSAGYADCYASVVKNVSSDDIDALERVVQRYKGQIACIIMEAVAYNSALHIRKRFLEQVREICNREGIVLIFDEVISGFRMRPGSAQAYFGVTPDLTTLAKALGGGFPIAAVAGKRDIMNTFNPVGKVVASGTAAGALMPVMAAIECMKMVKEPEFYDTLETIGDAIYGGINELFKKHGMPGFVRGLGARFNIFFGLEDPEMTYNWRTIADNFDIDMKCKFIKEALDSGLYFHDYGVAPTPPHCGFGTAHTLDDINTTLNKMDAIFAKIK